MGSFIKEKEASCDEDRKEDEVATMARVWRLWWPWWLRWQRGVCSDCGMEGKEVNIDVRSSSKEAAVGSSCNKELEAVAVVAATRRWRWWQWHW